MPTAGRPSDVAAVGNLHLRSRHDCLRMPAEGEMGRGQRELTEAPLEPSRLISGARSLRGGGGATGALGVARWPRDAAGSVGAVWGVFVARAQFPGPFGGALRAARNRGEVCRPGGVAARTGAAELGLVAAVQAAAAVVAAARVALAARHSPLPLLLRPPVRGRHVLHGRLRRGQDARGLARRADEDGERRALGRHRNLRLDGQKVNDDRAGELELSRLRRGRPPSSCLPRFENWSRYSQKNIEFILLFPVAARGRGVAADRAPGSGRGGLPEVAARRERRPSPRVCGRSREDMNCPERQPLGPHERCCDACFGR